MGAHVLLISPIPTHPQDQGNSARIHAVGRMLQSAGLILHFLYYPLEGLAPDQRRAMATCWDHLHVVPVSGRGMGPTGEGFYRLDDWWDPAVADAALALHRRWRFSAVITNYVWFSGVLEAFGDDVVKILDTHDVFGGRAERFTAAGLAPEWFYTTPAEEARGLARADVVLAIQGEEAAHFRALGHGNVKILGHILPRRTRLPRPGGGPMTVGYVASGNPINVASFERLRARLCGQAPPDKRFLVAGSVCGKLAADTWPFEALGRVDHLDEFYDRVDLVVNPMPFGTGLKIKSVEAVFEGLPLIATQAAMIGLPACHALHALTSPEDVAECLSGVTEGDLIGLAGASRDCAREYAAGVYAAFRDVVGAIDRSEEQVR